MRSKIMHNAAEECINEIMDAFLDGRQKSNVLFQKKLKPHIMAKGNLKETEKNSAKKNEISPFGPKSA